MSFWSKNKFIFGFSYSTLNKKYARFILNKKAVILLHKRHLYIPFIATKQIDFVQMKKFTLAIKN